VVVARGAELAVEIRGRTAREKVWRAQARRMKKSIVVVWW
jgi:hypothetical protein